MRTRRTILKAALAAPFVIPDLARAQPLRKVKFTLPWVAEGSNAVAFVAKANGYWSEAGLDVEISRGYGSVAAAQSVGAGQFEFGMGAASAGIQQAAKGLPVVAIGCLGYDATMCLAVNGDSPAHVPKDLTGKSIGGTVNSGEYPFLPAFAQAAGLDLSTCKLVQVDPNVRQRILMEHQVDAICGFAISIAPIFVANNKPIRFMPYSAYGLKLYNNSIFTQIETLHKEPKLCEAVAKGMLKASKFCLLNRKEAVNIFLKQVPEAALSANGPKTIETGLGIYNLTAIGEPSKKVAIGEADEADYASMTDLVMKYLGAPGDKRPVLSDLFTNQFVGDQKLTAEEWAKVATDVKEYNDLFT
jgi:ABC-type nitrate/sulfonate/bicarbonate transport system substrate-binding protein